MTTTKYSKQAAIDRMRRNDKLNEILSIEPLLLPIINMAVHQENVEGYADRVEKESDE